MLNASKKLLLRKNFNFLFPKERLKGKTKIGREPKVNASPQQITVIALMNHSLIVLLEPLMQSPLEIKQDTKLFID